MNRITIDGQSEDRENYTLNDLQGLDGGQVDSIIDLDKNMKMRLGENDAVLWVSIEDYDIPATPKPKFEPPTYGLFKMVISFNEAIEIMAANEKDALKAIEGEVAKVFMDKGTVEIIDVTDSGILVE